MDENDKFEIINMLYYNDTGYTRPGKDSIISDSSSRENINRFNIWCKERLLERALNKIYELAWNK